MCHHLLDARIGRPGAGFQPFEQPDLGRRVERGQRVVRQVERMCRCRTAHLHGFGLSVLAGEGNRTHGLRGRIERHHADIVGIGKGGLFTAHGTHPDAGINIEAARFDDPFFKAPRLGAAVLEVEIGVIDLMGHDRAEHPAEIGNLQPEGRQQGGLRLCQQGWFGVDHCFSVWREM